MFLKYEGEKIALIITTSFFVLNTTFAQSSQEAYFTSANSSEAILEFDGFLKHKFNEQITSRSIRSAINLQLKFLVGSMSFATPHGVPREEYDISNIKILNKDKITYHFKGFSVVEKNVSAPYSVILPLDPFNIYRKSFQGKINPCTDQYHQSEGSFWYFWSPLRPNCKLEKDKDYIEVTANLERKENAKMSYPEYNNLFDDNGHISIDVFFSMENAKSNWNPLKSNDFNAGNYLLLRNYLLKEGYVSKLWTKTQIKKIIHYEDEYIPYVETIQKGKVIYRLFFGSSELSQNGRAFHWFYKDAIEHASIMFYSGHSGLGRRLVLNSIEEAIGEKIKFNTSKYQIFFFDSCSSYRYYNQMYFDRKKTLQDPRGTKKLDIMATGLATYFNTMGNSSVVLAKALERAIQNAIYGNYLVSYQELARELETDNLFSVSGDEDN